MKETDGGDEQVKSEKPVRFYVHGYVEHASAKVALGNLFLQKQIEQQVEEARGEYARLVAMIGDLDEKIAKVPSTPTKPCSPPGIATFLLAFIAPKNTVQPFLGDLEEVFHKNAARFGERQAGRQYWMQVLASLGPLAWQWIKRMGFVTVLVDYFRTKFGL